MASSTQNLKVLRGADHALRSGSNALRLLYSADARGLDIAAMDLQGLGLGWTIDLGRGEELWVYGQSDRLGADVLWNHGAGQRPVTQRRAYQMLVAAAP